MAGEDRDGLCCTVSCGTWGSELADPTRFREGLVTDVLEDCKAYLSPGVCAAFRSEELLSFNAKDSRLRNCSNDFCVGAAKSLDVDRDL